MEPLIYIIDNDIVSRFCLEIKIKQSRIPCRVIGFDTAEQGLERLIESLDKKWDFPDILFFDLDKYDGGVRNFIEFFESLDNRPKETDIYIFTSYICTNDSVRIGEHPSVKGHFKKPLSGVSLNELFLRRI